MAAFWQGVLFGIVEGITEWLPVSSTGHLLLLDQFVQLQVSAAFYEMFQVVIQLGAILAVFVLFWDKLTPFSKEKNSPASRENRVLWGKILVAVIPSAVLGLLLDDWMDAHLYRPAVVAAALVGYGAAFLWIEGKKRGKAPALGSVSEISMPVAAQIGLFQCLSLVPGTSRSGATILGALLLGVSRPVGAEFSFFLAIPTMLGAGGLKTVKFFLEGKRVSGTEWAVLIAGCATAFLVSLGVIRALTGYVQRHSFRIFGWYRIALGLAVVLFTL